MFERKRVTQKVVMVLPTTAKTFIQITPRPLLKLSLEHWLNIVFRAAIQKGEMGFLQKRKVNIQVTDIGLNFSAVLSQRRLKVDLSSNENDVYVKAELADFVLLICGKVDPDTLFFRRRLKISGDTELGLALKNFLDRLDAEHMLPRYLYRILLELTEGFIVKSDNTAAQKEAVPVHS